MLVFMGKEYSKNEIIDILKRNIELEKIVVNLSIENQSYKLKELKEESSIYFHEYLSFWLEHHKQNIEETTYDGYKLVLEKHIIPYFVDKKIMLKNLKTIDIQNYYDYKLSCGLSANTIIRHHANIHRALDYACKIDLIDTNVSDKVDLPKKQKYRSCFYTVDELNQILDIAKNSPAYTPIYLTGLLGLRRSEVLGLKWNNIDFNNNTVKINRKVVKYPTSNKIVIKDKLKTELSYRTLPLPDALISHLYVLKQQRAKNSNISNIEDEFICLNKNNTLYKPDALSKAFKKIVKESNLHYIRFHDLRHSCASMLHSLGYDLKTIQEWLGHSDIGTTGNVYVHLQDKNKEKVAADINMALKK
jgi:integrase